MKIKNITEDEVATLKEARKILRKFTRTFSKATDRIDAIPNAEDYVPVQAELDRWADDLYRKAHVDFLGRDAFIALDMTV